MAVAPISKRPSDLVIVIFFITFIVLSLCFDLFQALSGENATLENTKDLPWPQALKEAYFWWTDICDPLIRANPVWLRVMSFVSPVVYIPYWLLGIYAFLFGKEWIRTPTIMFCTALIYSLIVIFAEHIYGPYKSHNLPLIFAAYGPYLLFPIFLLIRVLPRTLFQSVSGNRKNAPTVQKINQAKKKRK
eukprot:TRINITY_DN1103_c0_g1_i1.p1 TRINITY_DN1103_c0_g1~~TRINITY_DN1103_c0_g1_i1.p1  ORF type:complete len:189 (-),score=19.28 TRINITY_DN1103_c0_g1_i1:54-620(-)